MIDEEALTSRCPQNKGGGQHHFTTKSTPKGLIVTCLTCKKTMEQVIREANRGTSS